MSEGSGIPACPVEIIILRGIPGSGKTTWIGRNLDSSRIRTFSADDFFTDDEGVYRFDPDRIQDAHSDCLMRFLTSLRDAESLPGEDGMTIVVDNTNTSAWEIAPYYSLARAFGHPVRIVCIECDPVTAHSRNVHGVSLEQVMKMHHRMENSILPSWWLVDDSRDSSDEGCQCPEVEPGPS